MAGKGIGSPLTERGVYDGHDYGLGTTEWYRGVGEREDITVPALFLSCLRRFCLLSRSATSRAHANKKLLSLCRGQLGDEDRYVGRQCIFLKRSDVVAKEPSCIAERWPVLLPAGRDICGRQLQIGGPPPRHAEEVPCPATRSGMGRFYMQVQGVCQFPNMFEPLRSITSQRLMHGYYYYSSEKCQKLRQRQGCS